MFQVAACSTVLHSHDRMGQVLTSLSTDKSGQFYVACLASQGMCGCEAGGGNVVCTTALT